MATFAFDLDGTICFDGHTIASIILDTIGDLANRHQVLIASARHPVNIRDVIPASVYDQLDIVGANGAITYAHGVRNHVETIGDAVVRRVMAALDEIGCAYLAYGEDFAIPGRTSGGASAAIKRDIGRKLRLGTPSDTGSVLKVLALPDDRPQTAADVCESIGGIRIERHSDTTFDIVKDGIDKSVGIRALLPPAAALFAAFGNDANDLPMLAMSRNAISVGSHPVLQKLSWAHIPYGADQSNQIVAVIRQLDAIAQS